MLNLLIRPIKFALSQIKNQFLDLGKNGCKMRTFSYCCIILLITLVIRQGQEFPSQAG